MLETSRQHRAKENPFNYQHVILPHLTIPNLLIATENSSHTDYTHFCTPVWDILITQEASIENPSAGAQLSRDILFHFWQKIFFS